MSASPLPALPITPPTPVSSAPPPSNHNPSGPSFTSHLQTAQHQQQATSDPSASQHGDTQQDGNGSTNTQASTPSNNASDKPGTAASSSASTNDASDDDAVTLDIPGVGTLASAVLSLIDHATGDTHNDASPSTSGTTTKPATQTATKQTAATPAPTAALAGIVPVPLPVAAAPAAITTTANGGTSNAVDGVSSGATISKSADDSLTGLQKNALGGPDFSASGSSADGSDANSPAAASVLSDVAAAVQGAANTSQASAGSAVAPTHTFAAVTSALADNTSQSTSGLAALGNLTATAPLVPAGTGATGAHNLGMNAPVGSSGFAKELGQQITWLSGQDIKQAQIRLNPQDLGPLDVKVSVEHGRVDVSFMTQHPAATAAVQQGMNQLNQ
ncbi:MAG TPA: flagellar hook-length control protein FliK, partial [Dyella sp.]|nr:flagellar hook-length control protein FliK [Dyella sp.]